MKNKIIVLLVAVSFSCSTKESRNVPVDTVSMNTTVIDSMGIVESKKSTIALFDKDQEFDVISSMRSTTNQSSVTDTVMCTNWTIEKKNINRIIKECEPISGEDWHHLFDVLPCVVKGQMVQNNLTYNFEINAGSWVYISSADTTFMLGSFKKQNEKYFLSAAEK